MAKRKLPFIRLTVIFTIIIMAAMFYSWGYSRNNQSSGMMDQSMGEMMGENHLKEITIRDLIVQEEQSKTAQTADSMASHHSVKAGFLSVVHKITTLSIVILLPFIIAGSIFLMIIWFDKS